MADKFLLLLLLVLVSCGSGAPQNKDAVRQAILDHLGKRSDMMATAMKIEVVSVNFREKEADAVVSIAPKEGGEGMQMTYNLTAEGNTWVVKKSGSGGSDNPHGGAMPGGAGGGAANPHTGPNAIPMTPGAELPKGHPPVDPEAAKKAPAHK